MRILVVEDDRTLCEAICLHLTEAGYETEFCHSGDEALLLGMQKSHDLLLLDRMLPALDGLTLLSILRKNSVSVPVLMITALNGVGDRVEGLDAGADDYLVKPFAMAELLARIRALARRPQQWEPAQTLTCGDATLDLSHQSLSGPSGSCTLSKRELQLLEALFRSPGQTLPRPQLFARVWGNDADVEDGNLDSYIHFLRRRLQSVGSATAIKTVHSVGYRLEGGASC